MIAHSLPLIAGVDEAGRGPLAGPVVAAAVILDPNDPITGLRDSKKLSANRRTALTRCIREQALAFAVGIVHEQDIDRENILKATLVAMRQAVEGLPKVPNTVLVDGNRGIPGLNLPQETIIKGDQLIPAISAASILAKTTRDAMMSSYAVLFPQYQFERNAGYGTRAHMDALEKQGRCPIHRRTFAPVSHTENRFYRYTRGKGSMGPMGEILAGMFLIREGYQLLHHGYRAGRAGEIDLILKKDGLLVFTEVKSHRQNPNADIALLRVDEQKRKRIAQVATHYLEQLETEPEDVRFDVVTVDFSSVPPVITHFPTAFSPV